MLDNLGYNLLGLDSVKYEADPVVIDPLISCPGGSCTWGCTTGCAIFCSAGCTQCAPGCRFGPILSTGSTPAKTL